jgi:hypothetical protein
MNPRSVVRVVTSTTLVGLSSILTSSSSLGGVTGRGKLPKTGFCVSAVLELVPNVKIPRVGCVLRGFAKLWCSRFLRRSRRGTKLESERKPRLRLLRCLTLHNHRGLADSPGDGIDVDCSNVNGFELSVELVTPNPGERRPRRTAE